MSEQDELLAHSMRAITRATISLLNQLDNHEGDKVKQGKDWFVWKDEVAQYAKDKAQLAKVKQHYEQEDGRRLMDILVRVGIISKNATPTYSELLAAVETALEQKRTARPDREKILNILEEARRQEQTGFWHGGIRYPDFDTFIFGNPSKSTKEWIVDQILDTVDDYYKK